MDWQPVETAPKDGTQIMVWDCVHCSLIPWVRWDDDKQENGQPWGWMSDGVSWSGSFSHWMPFPDEPTE